MKHIYVSTACQHGVHDQCRLTCKFCKTECECTDCDHTKIRTKSIPDDSWWIKPYGEHAE